MSENWPTPTTVYGLWSTRDRVIRYIGQTTGEPAARLSHHKSEAKRGKGARLSRWVADELRDGFEVKMKTLHPFGDAGVSEIEYIALYRALGAPLLNVLPGAALPAEHAPIAVSLETRRKLSAAHKGRTASVESRAKLIASHRRKARQRLAQSQYFHEAIPKDAWY